VDGVELPVARGGDDDLPGPGEVVDHRVEGIGAVVRSALRAQAQIDDRLLSPRGGHLEDVGDAVDDVGRAEVGLHDAEIGARGDTHVAERGLAIARRASVTADDSQHVRSVPFVVDLRREPRLDLGVRPLRAVGEPCRRCAGHGLVPQRHEPRGAVLVLEVRMGEVDARIHDADQDSRAGLSRDRRRRDRAHGRDSGFDGHGVERRHAALGYFHAVDSGHGEKCLEEAERAARRHLPPDDRVHLDPTRAKDARRDVPLDHEIHHRRAMPILRQEALMDRQCGIDRLGQRGCDGARGTGRVCDGQSGDGRAPRRGAE
jgi:hypothetical protein